MKITAKGYVAAVLLIILYLGMTLIGFSAWQGYPQMSLSSVPQPFETLCIFFAKQC